MKQRHPKSVRRILLTILYEHYRRDPFEILGPEDFLEQEGITREELVFNMHYLAERQFVEMMIGYRPPLFAGVRLRPEGIDIIENRFEFNLRFPAEPGELEERYGEVPVLIERLVEEADLSPLDGEARRCLLRDVQYLRDEVARPAARWRRHVIHALLDWLAEPLPDFREHLPSLARLREVLGADTLSSN